MFIKVTLLRRSAAGAELSGPVLLNTEHIEQIRPLSSNETAPFTQISARCLIIYAAPQSKPDHVAETFQELTVLLTGGPLAPRARHSAS